MSNPELPRKTKELVLLPEGERVLVVILNSLYREQADTESRRAAVRACLRFRKGGADYKALQEELRSKGEDGQGQYLAGREYRNIKEQAESRFPSEPEPEQGEGTPEEYADVFAKWQDAEVQKQASRREYEELEWQREVNKCKALPARKRLEECEVWYLAQEFGRAYSERIQWETLYRACRNPDAPTQRFYESADELEGAEDAVQEALWQAYQSLEVNPGTIPTSPQNSPE